MALYESKSNSKDNLPGGTNENPNTPSNKEAFYRDMAKYVDFEQIKIMENQKENGVCKIINGNKLFGTGFLALIPYPDRLNLLSVLITCNHVVSGNEKEIKLIFNDSLERTLKLNNTRKIYTNNLKDIKIIEIKKEDNYNINNILEIDYDIFDNKNLNNKFKSIYIIHFPFGNQSSLSIGIIEKTEDDIIKHKCATEKGSSGSPIINLNNLKL